MTISSLRILVLLPTSPLPIFSGGRQRMYQVLRRLAPRHEITVLSFWRDSEGREGLEQLAKALPLKVVAVPFVRLRPNVQLPGVAGRRLWGKLRQWPDDVAIWNQPTMYRLLAETLAQQPFDLIQVEWPYLAQYALSHPRLPNILITHDIFSVALARRATVQQGHKQRYLQRQARLWQRYERSIYAACDSVAAMSQADATIIRQRADNANIVILPNGVDTEALPFKETRSRPRRLIFVGSPTHEPNLDAACWLLTEIWPVLHRRYPQLQLTLVNLDHPRVRACMQPGVTLSGRLPELAAVYREADIALVPLRAGSGTRLKILEAFASGLPVVSTGVGYEGLEVEPGVHLLAAETAADFVSQIENLLVNENHRRLLAKNARQLVEERYDWQHITHLYEIAYQQLLLQKKSIVAGR
ncbi:MAG: glycosyltransferase [Chloroflexi bacterium]|nr:glycosyltransferase [Chloroflexota bacterium]